MPLLFEHKSHYTQIEDKIKHSESEGIPIDKMNKNGAVVWEFHQEKQDLKDYPRQAEEIIKHFKKYDNLIFSFHTPLGLECDPASFKRSKGYSDLKYIFHLIEFGNFLVDSKDIFSKERYVPLKKQEVYDQLREVTESKEYMEDVALQELAAIMAREYSNLEYLETIRQIKTDLTNIEKIVVNYHLFSTVEAAENKFMGPDKKRNALRCGYSLYEFLEKHIEMAQARTHIIQTVENNPFIGQVTPGEKRPERLKIRYFDYVGRLPEDFQYMNFPLNRAGREIKTCLDISHMITVIDGYTRKGLRKYPPRKLDEKFYENELDSITRGKSRFANFIYRMPSVNLVHVSDARHYNDDGNRVFESIGKWAKILYTLEEISMDRKLPVILELRGAHHRQYFHYATDAYRFLKRIYDEIV
jgi:hypothetical protein